MKYAIFFKKFIIYRNIVYCKPTLMALYNAGISSQVYQAQANQALQRIQGEATPQGCPWLQCSAGALHLYLYPIQSYTLPICTPMLFLECKNTKIFLNGKKYFSKAVKI